MIVERDITKVILKYINRKEYICITGPRQSGKTTLLHILRDSLVDEHGKEIDTHIINFEDRNLLFQFEQAPLEFIRSYKKDKNVGSFIFLDEYQYVKDGGQKLKLIYDTINSLKIFITGSSSMDIQSSLGKFMVGRILNFSLTPFSFGEYLKSRQSHLYEIYRKNHEKLSEFIDSAKPIESDRGPDPFANELLKHYENYCIWGGFPAVALTSNIDRRKKILSELLNNYLFKDINFLLNKPRERSLLLLLQHLSASTGNLISYQNLGERSGLTYRKIKQYLEILIQTFICYELKPLYKKKSREISKNPKIYFSDPGFRNVFINNYNQLNLRSDSGAIIENSVLIGLKQILGEFSNINFWRTKAGAEVDFAVTNQNRIIPIEVKYSNFKREKITRSYYSFLETFKPRNGIILTKNFFGHMKKNKTDIYFIPVYYL